MFRSTRFATIFALVLGLVAAAVVWNSQRQLQSQVEQARNQAEPTPIPQGDLLVAAQDLPAQTLLSPGLVKVVQVPRAALPPEALANPAQVAGKVLQYPVGSGQPILPQQFIVPPKPTSFAAVVPAGKRAMAVTVSDVTSAGGLISPGDHVDVVATFDKETMGKDTAVLVLQDLTVLAVGQQYVIDDDQPIVEPTPLATEITTPADPAKPIVPTATPTPKPTPVPRGNTITLAVAPEQAQRLALAEDRGHLRLVLRASNDGATTDLPDATLSSIRQELATPTVQILGVEISPANLHAGDSLQVKVTIKNTSDKPITSEDPQSGYAYVQGQTFFSQGFASEAGKIRVGLSFDGHPSAPFPYRWGFVGELAPGAQTTISGSVKMTYDVKPTNFWVGLIQEPDTVLQDNEGTTLITVLPSNVAVVSVDAANVRSGPDLASSVLTKLPYGTEVPILGQEKDWFKVKLADGREGYVAAGWIIAPEDVKPDPNASPIPATALPATPATTPTPQPVTG